MSKPRKSKYDPWDGDISDLDYVGNGISGLVVAIDESRVAKISLGTRRSVEDIETERQVYRRFGSMRNRLSCRYILSCLDTEHPRGLVFERCQETLRSRLSSRKPSFNQALTWATQMADGLSYVHSCNIIQGDVGCHNCLLDSKDSIKLADFAGSVIEGSDLYVDASVTYEVRSRLPHIAKPSRKSDIFALGSAIYEVATGHRPYEQESYRRVQTLYIKGIFPSDVNKVPKLGPIIKKCWHQEFQDADEVAQALRTIRQDPASSHGSDSITPNTVSSGPSSKPKSKAWPSMGAFSPPRRKRQSARDVETAPKSLQQESWTSQNPAVRWIIKFFNSL